MSDVAGRLAAVEKVKRDGEVVADRVRGLRWATIAERHADEPVQDSVRLGALKALVATQHERMDLLMSVGLLPHDLGLIRHEIDVRRLTRTVLEVFDRHGVSRNVRTDVAEVLRGGRLLQPSVDGARRGRTGASASFR